MDETETFRLLSRPTMDEVNRAAILMSSDEWKRLLGTDTLQRKYLVDNGWTYDEWISALDNRHKILIDEKTMTVNDETV